MLLRLRKVASSPFIKLPLILTGILIAEKVLLYCYTYLESTNFDLM